MVRILRTTLKFCQSLYLLLYAYLSYITLFKWVSDNSTDCFFIKFESLYFSVNNFNKFALIERLYLILPCHFILCFLVVPLPSTSSCIFSCKDQSFLWSFFSFSGHPKFICGLLSFLSNNLHSFKLFNPIFSIIIKNKTVPKTYLYNFPPSSGLHPSPHKRITTLLFRLDY